MPLTWQEFSVASKGVNFSSLENESSQTLQGKDVLDNLGFERLEAISEEESDFIINLIEALK